jgi:hypothetical protein
MLYSGRIELKQNLPNRIVRLSPEYFEVEDKMFYQNTGVVEWVVFSCAYMEGMRLPFACVLMMYVMQTDKWTATLVVGSKEVWF